MSGYSLDLRERIVKAIDQGEGKTAVSKRFDVSLSTVKRYLKRHEQGQLAPIKGGGRKRLLDTGGCEQLRQQVKAHHDWSLEQHASALSERTGTLIKKSALGNYLKRLGISHKKRASSLTNEMQSNENSTSTT